MRKLATVRRIGDITPIEGDGAIECAHVDGWMVVVKKGEYSVGDLAVYCDVGQGMLLPLSTVFELHPKTSVDILYTDVTDAVVASGLLDSDKLLEASIETCLSSLSEFDTRLCPLQNIPEAWDVMAEMFSSIEKIKHLFPKRD